VAPCFFPPETDANGVPMQLGFLLTIRSAKRNARFFEEDEPVLRGYGLPREEARLLSRSRLGEIGARRDARESEGDRCRAHGCPPPRRRSPEPRGAGAGGDPQAGTGGKRGLRGNCARTSPLPKRPASLPPLAARACAAAVVSNASPMGARWARFQTSQAA
jgi:hypothetical protein